MTDVVPNREAPQTQLPSWGGSVLTVLRHELSIEVRTGEVVLTSAFFAVLVVVLASFAFFMGPRTSLQIAAGAIWLSVAFAAVLAVARSWQREREELALWGLLVSPLPRGAFFLGKALALWIFLTLIEAVVLPLCALFFSLSLGMEFFYTALIAAIASPGIAASSTLFGAITVRTRARDLLLATVLLPLLAPQLLVAVVATREILLGAPLGHVTFHLALLGLFDLIFILGGLTLFGSLIED